MNKKTSKWVLSVALLLVSSSIHAQVGPCPPGMSQYPSPNGIPSCGPLRTDDSQAQGHWVTQWGAVAQGENGTGGFSSNQFTKEAAKQAAIDNCEARGGRQCTVDDGYVYYNGCIAIVNGTSQTGQGQTNGYIAHTYKDAVKNAIKTCKSSGQTGCELFRAECSPAKWVGN